MDRWQLALEKAAATGKYVYLYYRNGHGNKMLLMESGTWVNQWVFNPRNVKLYSTLGRAACAAKRLCSHLHVGVGELTY